MSCYHQLVEQGCPPPTHDKSHPDFQPDGGPAYCWLLACSCGSATNIIVNCCHLSRRTHCSADISTDMHCGTQCCHLLGACQLIRQPLLGSSRVCQVCLQPLSVKPGRQLQLQHKCNHKPGVMSSPAAPFSCTTHTSKCVIPHACNTSQGG